MSDTKSYFIISSWVDIAPYGVTDGDNKVGKLLRPDDESEVWENLGWIESSTPSNDTNEQTVDVANPYGVYQRRRFNTIVDNRFEFTVREVKRRTLEMAYRVADGKPWVTSGEIQVWIRTRISDANEDGKGIAIQYYTGRLRLTTPPTNSASVVTATFAMTVEDSELATHEWLDDSTGDDE